MSAPINRGTDGLSQRVYALIFNGITRASSVATDRHDGWLPLSERERYAEAVYAELAAGNIEFRLGGLALLAQVAGEPPAFPTVEVDPAEVAEDLEVFARHSARLREAEERTSFTAEPPSDGVLRCPQDWTAEEFTAVFGAPDPEDGETR